MMKPQTTLLAIAAALAACAAPTPGAAQCEPDGDVRFLCGPPSPEDLIAVPGTPWVMVSSRISDDDGYLIAADTRDLSTTTIYTASTLRTAPGSMDTYRACPSPPTATFQPHGIALRPGQGGRHTLYVVAHGARESVEVFELDVTGTVPSLAWIGCVVAPESVSLNSVAPLPGGSIVVTNFNVARGELWEWSPSGGWSEVPGSSMRGPNGVVASPDGRWLYVGGWGEEALVRLSRGADAVQRSDAPVGFHIDNVRWAPDGSLLVAGQYGSEVASIGGCLNGRSCEGVASRAARVGPETLAVDQLVDYPSNELLIFGTVAIEVGDELWFGGIAGGERVARFPL
jgi:hypothetical protein